MCCVPWLHLPLMSREYSFALTHCAIKLSRGPCRGRDVRQLDAVGRLVSSNSLAMSDDVIDHKSLQIDGIGLVQRIYMRVDALGINAAAEVSCVDFGALSV